MFFTDVIGSLQAELMLAAPWQGGDALEAPAGDKEDCYFFGCCRCSLHRLLSCTAISAVLMSFRERRTLPAQKPPTKA